MPAARPAGLAALTATQRRVYDYLRAHVRAHKGRAPTLRATAAAFGFKSVNGVRCHLLALEKKGLIVRAKGEARGITLVDDEPLRAAAAGGLVVLDCGDRVYHLDADGARRLAAALLAAAAAT